MYATRFADGPRFRPASMAAALAINGGVIAALLLASPEVQRIMPIPPITIFNPAPEPSPPPPDPQPSPTSRIKQPQPQPSATPDPGPTPIDHREAADNSTGTLPGGDATGSGGSGAIDPPKPLPSPAFVGASFDPRYAADVEPPYPDIARDAGTEGVVRLRITIGADGRVKRADGLEGNAVLLRAAIRHVLAHWRFRPATLGGIAQESSKVMMVRFRLDT